MQRSLFDVARRAQRPLGQFTYVCHYLQGGCDILRWYGSLCRDLFDSLAVVCATDLCFAMKGIGSRVAVASSHFKHCPSYGLATSSPLTKWSDSAFLPLSIPVRPFQDVGETVWGSCLRNDVYFFLIGARENSEVYLSIYVMYDTLVQVVTIEAFKSVIGTFAPSTDNLNNITLGHMKMYIAFAGCGDTNHYSHRGG